MAGGSLASLTIDLAANITRFERGLNRAERLADKRSKSIGRTFTRMATSLGAALASFGFLRAVEQSLSFADSIGKTADKLGIATDALQEYRFAAEQTGVSQQALDVGIQRFSRRVAEAAEGSGVLKDVLERLNIPLRDAEGNLRSTEDVLNDYADAIKNAGSSNEQLLLAFKAFDTEGVAFVNTLKGGSSGLQAFRDEAQALGVVMDEELIRNAEKANDQLSQVSQVLKIQMTSAAVELAPHLTEVAQAFTDLVKGDAAKIPQWAKNIAIGFAEITEGAKGVGSTVEALYKILNLDLLDVGEIPAIWDEYLLKVIAAEDKTNEFIESLDEGIQLRIGIDLSTEEIAQRIDQVTALIAEKQAQLAESQAVEGDENNMLRGVLPSPETLESEIERLTELLIQWDSIISERNLKASEPVDGASKRSIFTGQTVEEMNADFAAYESILSQAATAHDRHIREREQAVASIGAFQVQQERDLLSNTIAYLSAKGAQDKKYAKAALALSKALAIAEVIVSTRAAVAKAFETYGPTPAGYAAAAAMIGMGALNVGLIAATGLQQASNLSAGVAVSGPTETVGTETDPFVTTQTGTTGTITINVNGVITEEILQDLIVPAIQEATNDKDIILFRSDSRQALELT